MTEQSQRKVFKDYFDRSAVQALARQGAAAMPEVDQEKFVGHATRGLTKLEFSGRVQLFADALAVALPASPQALTVLARSLPAPLPDCESVSDGWL